MQRSPGAASANPTSRKQPEKASELVSELESELVAQLVSQWVTQLVRKPGIRTRRRSTPEGATHDASRFPPISVVARDADEDVVGSAMQLCRRATTFVHSAKRLPRRLRSASDR
jgi:hypothetical protein